MLTINKIAKIPEILWIQVFKYCDIRDFLKLRLISKVHKEFADKYADIYERECLRLYTSDLQLFR